MVIVCLHAVKVHLFLMSIASKKTISTHRSPSVTMCRATRVYNGN